MTAAIPSCLSPRLFREPDIFIVIYYKYHLANFDNLQFILQTSQPLKPHAKEPVVNYVALFGIVEQKLFVLERLQCHFDTTGSRELVTEDEVERLHILRFMFYEMQNNKYVCKYARKVSDN